MKKKKFSFLCDTLQRERIELVGRQRIEIQHSSPMQYSLQFISRATPEDVLRHPDTSETVYISSLALLKMLRHGRAGVPMEVKDIFSLSYD